MNVALSVALLFAAPLLAALLLRRPLLATALDSFVLVAVGGIVALHVVPQSAELAGAVAVVVAAAGLFLPIALHRVDDALRASPSATGALRVRDLALFAVLLAGVGVHALLDGAALAGDDDALALGVILHRVPVGIALWVVGRAKLGLVRTVVVALAYAGGTVAGAVVAGPALLASASAPALALFQAFVAGSILHIVAESAPFTTSTAPPRPPALGPPRRLPRAPAQSWRSSAAGLAGAVVAVVALYVLEHGHGGGHAEVVGAGAGGAFLSIALACAPAALLSFIVVGFVTALYPDGAPRIRARHTRVVDAAAGAAAGLPHPLCSCAVAPLYDELVDRGAPPATARAFLVAAPELGVPALLLTARLLGLPFMIARVVGAALLALIAGATALGAASTPSLDEREPRPPLAPRLMHGLRHGIVDAVDHVGPWLLLGVAVAAAVVSGAVDLTHIPSELQVAVAAAGAFPLYLCAAGATPVAAALLAQGASAGAVLALLLVGPCVSLPTLSLVRRRHGTRAALAFALAVMGGAVAVGVVVDALVPGVAPREVARQALAAEPGIANLACAVAVAALLVASLARQGVRGFLLQVMSPQHSHAGDHEHGPGCGHDHGPAVVDQPLKRVALAFDPRRPRGPAPPVGGSESPNLGDS